MRFDIGQFLKYFRRSDEHKPPIMQAAQTPLPETMRVELERLLIRLQESTGSIKEIEDAFLVKASDYSKQGYNLSNHWRTYREWHHQYYRYQATTPQK